MKEKLRILFLCTGNSCRSQMAEGWARYLKGDVIEPYSAGIEPRGLDPYALQVMEEAGVDISKQTSKHVKDLLNIPFDYVITVCDQANEACPIFPGKVKRIHMGFDDPPRLTVNLPSKKAKLGVYRRVRDEIKRFIETLPEALPE